MEDPDAARQLCSYLGQAPVPIDALRLREAIEVSGQIRGSRRQDVRCRADELIDALQLREWGAHGRHPTVRWRATAGRVRYGRDPARRGDDPGGADPAPPGLLCDDVRALSRAGVAVLLVAHNVLEAEESVDRLAVIDRGKVIAEGRSSPLKSADRGQLRLQVMLAPGAQTPETPASSRVICARATR